MGYVPENITRFYISLRNNGVPVLTENYIYYYLGQNNIFVSGIKKITPTSFVATVKYEHPEDIKKLYQSDVHPMKIRRIFKSATYRAFGGDELSPLNGLFAEMAANLLGLLDKKKAVVGITVSPHHRTDRAIKDKFVEMAIKYRDERKADTVFDPKESNIEFHIHFLRKPKDIVEVITWLEDKSNLLD